MKSDKSVQDEEIVKLLKTSANPKVKTSERLKPRMFLMKYFSGCEEEEEGSREGSYRGGGAGAGPG